MEGGDEYHHHRARPELQVHRRQPMESLTSARTGADARAQSVTHFPVRYPRSDPVGSCAHPKTPKPFRCPHRPCHDDESHKSGRHPEGLRRLLHRFDKNFARQRHQQRNARQRGRARTMGHGASLASPPSALANNSRCVLSENSMPNPYATISNTASPTLNLWVNADAPAESACEIAEGINSAIVARKSRPACMRALTRLYSCTWYLSPPRKNDAPNINKCW